MKHLRDTGMTYWQHMGRALSIALVLVVHAFLPGIWTTKASSMLCDNHEDQT